MMTYRSTLRGKGKRIRQLGVYPRRIMGLYQQSFATLWLKCCSNPIILRFVFILSDAFTQLFGKKPLRKPLEIGDADARRQPKIKRKRTFYTLSIYFWRATQ